MDGNWKLHHVVIDLLLLHGLHSRRNFSEAFSDTLNEYDLWKKLLAITTDNASNIDTFH